MNLDSANLAKMAARRRRATRRQRRLPLQRRTDSTRVPSLSATVCRKEVRRTYILHADQLNFLPLMNSSFHARRFGNSFLLSDLQTLPVFKNYSAGTQTSRLYVKNLPKSADEDALRRVFGSYVDWSDPDEVSKYVV